MEGVLKIENHREIENHEQSTEFRVRDMGLGGAVVFFFFLFPFWACGMLYHNSQPEIKPVHPCPGMAEF